MKLQLHEAKIDLGRIALRLLQNHLTSFGSSSLIARDTAEHDQEKLELESLTKILIDNENTVRLASFVALLAVFGAVEIFIPRV